MDVLHTDDPVHLTYAIEDNGAEFLLQLGRAGGGEERKAPAHWIIGGSPIDYHNAVVGAALNSDTAADTVAESIAVMRRHRVPGCWHLGPSMNPPPDLGEILVEHGFTYAGDDIGMAADLSALTPLEPVPGLAITLVETPADLAVWTETLAQGFGEGPSEARWVGDMYARLGLANSAWRHYVGRLDGVPVATATMLYAAGVAGLYFIFTVDAARRKGIGAAMTLAPLLDAKEAGYRIGVLGASSMGEPVYRKLGFREYCRIGLYEWMEPVR